MPRSGSTPLADPGIYQSGVSRGPETAQTQGDRLRADDERPVEPRSRAPSTRSGSASSACMTVSRSESGVSWSTQWHHWMSENLVGFEADNPGMMTLMAAYYRNVALWLATPTSASACSWPRPGAC